MYSIGEFSRIIGVDRTTLRNWENYENLRFLKESYQRNKRVLIIEKKQD